MVPISFFVLLTSLDPILGALPVFNHALFTGNVLAPVSENIYKSLCSHHGAPYDFSGVTTQCKIIRTAPPPPTMVVHSKVDPDIGKDSEDLSITSFKYLPDALYKFQTDLVQNQNNFQNYFLTATSISHVLQHAYYTDARHLIYMPPDDGILLFDRFSVEDVRSFMAANIDAHPFFFSLVILRDYIIPVFQKQSSNFIMLSGLPGIDVCFRPFLQRLLWVAYFAEGRVRMQKSKILRESNKILLNFGLEWGQMRFGIGNQQSFKNHEKPELQNIMRTYFLAKWCDFDIKSVAEKTSALKVSQQILADHVPNQLADSTYPSSAELFFIIFGVIPSASNAPVPQCQPISSKKRERTPERVNTLATKRMKLSLEDQPTTAELPIIHALTEQKIESETVTEDYELEFNPDDFLDSILAPDY